MADVSAHVQQTWLRYKDDGDLTARNELVVHYTSLVRYVAYRVSTGLPNTIDRDDLVSYGTFGLMDAISKFDLGKGVKFETYAMTRIKGSIIDGIREQDWVPRSVRSKSRDFKLVKDQLENDLGRAPVDTELAAQLEITLPALWALKEEAAVTSVTTLDDRQGDADRASVGDLVFDLRSNPEDLYGQTDIVLLLADAIDRMPDRFKTILALYYVEEMTLAGIGSILGVTESRVSQLQSKLLQSLRRSLSEGRAQAA